MESRADQNRDESADPWRAAEERDVVEGANVGAEAEASSVVREPLPLPLVPDLPPPPAPIESEPISPRLAEARTVDSDPPLELESPGADPHTPAMVAAAAVNPNYGQRRSGGAAVPPHVPAGAQPVEPPAPRRRRKGFFGHLKDFAIEVVKIVAIVLILRAYVLQASTVDGQSMEPTLHNGDCLLVERLSISLANLPEVIKAVLPNALIPKIEGGDIVVLTSPENGNNELVKRVVAVEGDRIFFHAGRIWVNGVPLDENYLPEEKLSKRIGRNYRGEVRHYLESDIAGMPSEYRVSESELDSATTLEERRQIGVKVPEGCLFVMGDNRESSKDSRAWTRTRISTDSPGSRDDGTDHLWATTRSVHGRVLMRLRLPWEYDEQHPVFPK